LTGNIRAKLRTRAQRIREHASNFAGDVAEPRMLELADELDARAGALDDLPSP
jgi:hypothetical protein